MTIRIPLGLALLPLLAACDPFATATGQRTSNTPAQQCVAVGGTPATRKAVDGSPWAVCTFRDARVCDLAKLRIDNRCYTDPPAHGS